MLTTTKGPGSPRLSKLPPNLLARPSIKCKSHYLLTTIKGEALQVKLIYHQTGQQDLQPGTNHTNSSQKSEEKLCKAKRKHHRMSDKTFNQVEIRPEVISSTSLLHARPLRPSFLHHQGLASTSTRSFFLRRQRFHAHGLFILPQVTEDCIDKGNYITYTQVKIHRQIKAKSLSKEEEQIIIITRPM